METVGHWLPVGSEGRQGGSSNAPRSPGDCEAVSRRATALLLSFYGTLKESKNSDALATERYRSVVQAQGRFLVLSRCTTAGARTAPPRVAGYSPHAPRRVLSQTRWCGSAMVTKRGKKTCDTNRLGFLD